ncbi:MAG: L-dopachrome tautomerase-related protein [Pseudomonadota bacterium]
MNRFVLVATLCVPVLLLNSASAAGLAPLVPEPVPGTLEVVAELDINPGNIAVTHDGRVFTTVHQFRRAPVQLIEITGFNQYKPWPNAAWNAGFGRGPEVFNSLLGIAIDHQGRLWVIDNGGGETNLPPKLLAFSLESGELVFRHDFPAETGPVGSFIQDLAVDDRNGWVYLADVGGVHEPAIVVVNLDTNRSRRFTASPALQAEDVDLVVENRILQMPDAQGELQPARLAINPITLSRDGETLFFGAMTGTTWYQVPTRLFREGTDDESIAAAIRPAGRKPVSDGAATDAEGNHYFTSLGANAIDVLRRDGSLLPLVQDERLLWPDALSFGESSWLYIAVNQLHRAPPLNGGEDRTLPPFRILRVWTGTKGREGC